MATFQDAKGGSHTFEFDAFILDELDRQAGVDLADLSAVGYQEIQQNARSLVKVLAVLCEASFQDFAKLITGQAITDGRKAVLEAAECFFPPSEWSELQSNLTKVKRLKTAIADGKDLADLQEVLQQIRPLMEAIEMMPPEMKASAKAEMTRQIENAGGDASDLERLEELISATGPATTQSKPATDSPANAVESQPAA